MASGNPLSPDGGALLTQMLEAHRTFLESVYSLMKIIEAEVTKHNWVLIRNGGFGVTRNGRGGGLAQFATGDWYPTYAAIAFGPPDLVKWNQGYTNTDIPVGGLDLLVFAVRWLEKSPREPVVWSARIHVERDGWAPPKKWGSKWEDFQSYVLPRLQGDPTPSASLLGQLKMDRYSASGISCVTTGEYLEVPVVQLQSPQDVVLHLLKPIL